MMLTCPLCEIEWSSWVLGPACPDCGNTQTRPVDWEGYMWKFAAASTVVGEAGKWGLR